MIKVIILMIKLFNQDSSFFEVTSPDSNIDVAEKDIKSLTIIEEAYKLTTGTIILRDDSQIYSNLFKIGSRISATWGFKDPLKAIQNVITDINNPLEIKGPIFRSNLTAILLTPSGTMNNDGSAEFIINFRSGQLFINERKTRNIPIIGTPMNKGLAITQVLVESGVPAPFVLFTNGPHRMTDDITKTPLKQSNETNFQFLRRKADEWNVFFRVGTDPAGISQAVFADNDKVQTSPFGALTTGGAGIDNLFDWRGGVKNVLNASWENNFVQDGTGDHVQLQIVGPGFVLENKQVVETETVVAFRLDMARLKAEMRSAERKKRGSSALLYQSIIDATDFQSDIIRRFWTATEFKTAPQGGGNKVIIETFGNPLYTPPNKVKLGLGFPERLTANAPNLKMRRVEHRLSIEGYKCKIDVRDLLHK